MNQTEINSIFVAQFDISDTLMQYLLVPNPPKLLVAVCVGAAPNDGVLNENDGADDAVPKPPKPLNDAPNPPNPADANYHNK